MFIGKPPKSEKIALFPIIFPIIALPFGKYNTKVVSSSKERVKRRKTNAIDAWEGGERGILMV